MRISACIFGGLLLMAAGSAAAQDDKPYETHLYRPNPPQQLEKNYGLPSFGMPGSELPRQRTMDQPSPEKADPPRASFYDIPSDGDDRFDLIKPPKAATAPGMETPLFTTKSDGMDDTGTRDSFGTGGNTFSSFGTGDTFKGDTYQPRPTPQPN